MPHSTLRRVARRALAVLQPEVVTHDGMRIPAKRLRFGGRHFQADDAFVSSARAEADRLVRCCGLQRESSVLEIGCGPGRLPLGILDRVGDVRSYVGIDVSETPIDWCRRHISREHPDFRFVHIDVHNPRYNPAGGSAQSALRLPVDDASVDIIYHYSVFSHLRESDIRAYLREFRRVLRPSGKIFFTAFVEQDVPQEEENPSGYGDLDWHGPLHCVRFEDGFFRRMLQDEGFTVTAFEYGKETDGQSSFLLQGTA